MSQTVKTTLGYGVKVDLDAIKAGTNYPKYAEDVLSDKEYPLLKSAISGYAPCGEYWVFIKSTCTTLYNGLSGNGMETPVKPQTQITENEMTQLRDWMDETGQEADPGYFLIQYVN